MIPAPFVEETIFTPLYCHCSFVKDQLNRFFLGSLFGSADLCVWSFCLATQWSRVFCPAPLFSNTVLTVLRLTHPGPPSSLSITVRFSHCGTDCCGSLSLWISAPRSYNSLYWTFWLQFEGEQFALWPDASKKNCWFFSLSSFLSARTQWQLLSYLHPGQETRTPTTCFYLLESFLAVPWWSSS